MPVDGWTQGLGLGVLLGAAASRHCLPAAAPASAAAVTTAPPLEPPVAESPGSAALVTGASPGTMGGCIAEALAAMGCDVAAVEHPLRLGECEALCEGLRKTHGVKAVALAADATDAQQVEASFTAAASQLGAEPSIVVSTVGGGGVA